MGAFHAYDIRGVFGQDFNLDDVYRMGYFLPQVLAAKTFLIGRDVRISSPDIHQQLIDGLTDAGAQVSDAGLATTPMIYFGTARFGFEASVMITASHNPAEYNGLKVSAANAVPVGYDSGLNNLEKLVYSDSPVIKKEGGRVDRKDFKADYLAFLLKYQNDYSGLNYGIDVSNGMAGLFVDDIFGHSPFYLFKDLDGHFPNHEANPLEPKNIVDLQNLVRTNKLDFGVIFDGDADRVMFVDENGTFISPDLLIALLGHYFLEDRKEQGPVIHDIRSSKAIAEYLEPMGGKTYMWKVGRAFAANKLREINGIYGGELAGHYYFRDFYYSDSGLLAAILIVNEFARLKSQGVTVSEAIARIRTYDCSGEINFKIAAKKEAMDAVLEYFTSKEQPLAFYDFDGYRIEYAKWWLNIRPSNTEPYLRLIVEASGKELLYEKTETVKGILAKFQ